MKALHAAQIRNVAVVGHNTVGKTTLVAAMLYAAGAITRPGKIDEGTCPTDFDGEENDRKISINLATASSPPRPDRRSTRPTRPSSSSTPSRGSRSRPSARGSSRRSSSAR
jgi:translation elongation factor EF-G